jgi:DNA-binding CsgD family transcriptional regulator
MSSTAGPSPLVERDLELRAMADLAAEVLEAGVRVVVLTGEAGGGKSRLWAEFERTLGPEWQRLEIAAHRTDESPMAPFDVLAGVVPADGEPARALGGAIAAALQERAASGPVALLVEDLHWFDPMPIAALVHVVRLLARTPVLVVGTFRLGERSHSPQARAVADLIRQPKVRELRLSSLSRAAVSDMVRAMCGRDDAALAAAVHERTGGNPLFVEEVLRDPGPGVPWTVAEAIEARVDLLPRPAQQLAGLLAAAGEPLPVLMLDELGADEVDSVQALVDAGLAVAVPGAPVGLRHAVVGEVVLARLTSDERRRMHASLATVLEQTSDTRPERIAHHWSEAGRAERAAPYAAVAADRFEGRRTYRTATDLYRVALRHPPADHVERAALYERAAASAALAGVGDLARRWAAEARRSYGQAERPWLAGRAWVNPTLDARGGSQDGDPETGQSDASSLIVRSQDAMRTGDLDLGRDLARRALGWGRQHDDHSMASFAALALVYAGAVDEGRAVLEGLAAEAAAEGDHARQARVSGYLSRSLRIGGDVQGALRFNRRTLASARSAADDQLWPHVQAAVAYVLAWHGHVAEAERLVDELVALDQTLFTAMAQVPSAMVDLGRGQLDAARTRLEPLVPAIRSLGVDYFTLGVLRLMAHLELLEGRPRSALDLLDEATEVVWSPLYEWHGDHLELRARAALALGDEAQLGHVAARLHELAHSARRGPAILAPAESVAAMIALAAGRHDEAAGRFRAAAVAWERASCWRPAADAWCDVAEAGGPPAATAEAIERAGAIAGAHGLWHARDRTEVAAAHVAASTLGGDELAVLTHREREIVILVGAGRTNREVGAELYLSEKTVRNYLSTAFAKLGISRRAEVVALLAGAAPGC